MARTLSPEAHEKILATAQELLVEDGIDGFTVDHVASRSGVAKSTIYRHFSNVHDLVVETLDCMIDPVATPDTGSLRADLIELFVQRLPLASDSEFRRMVLGLLSASVGDPELERVHQTMNELRSEPVRTVLALAMARGEIRPDINVEHAIDLIEGPLFMHLMIRDLPLDHTDVEALIDLAIAALR